MIDPKQVGFDPFLRRQVANLVRDSGNLRESQLGPAQSVNLAEFLDRFPAIPPSYLLSGGSATLVSGKVISLNGGETLITSVTSPTGAGAAHTHSISGSTAAGSAHTHTLSGSTDAGSAHTHTLSGSTAAGAAHSHTLQGVTAVYANAVTGALQLTVDGAIVGYILNSSSNATATESTHTHGVGTLVAANESTHTHAVGTLVAASESTHTHAVGTLANANESTHTHAITSSGATKYFVKYTP